MAADRGTTGRRWRIAPPQFDDELSDALFVPDGDGYLATEWSRGGWDDNLLHGGPPAGLLAWAIERHPTPVAMHLARVTFDLFRPIPLTRLEVDVRTVRAGKRIQIDRATLSHDGVVLANAIALRIRQTSVVLEDIVRAPWQPPGPPETHPHLEWMQPWSADRLTRYHRTTVETRSVDRSMEHRGPGTAWHRLTVPVVSGEDTSLTVQACAIADMLNGVSQTLSTNSWVYVNPDITVYMNRAPLSDWIGIQGHSDPHPGGIGVNQGTLFDTTGRFGVVAMAQLIEPARQRPPGFAEES